MGNATLRKIVTGFAAQDPAIIDSLLNASGILQTAAMEGANYNIWHKSKRVSALPSGSFVAPGGSVTDTTVDDEIIQTDLKLCRIAQSEAADLADSYPGGKSAFFENQLPAILEGLGQTLSKQIIYGTNSTFGDTAGFNGFHQIAKANSKVIDATGTSGSTTSIFAVRWKPGLCSILYNPGLMMGGKFVDIKEVVGGNLTSEVTNTTTGAKKYVYQYIYDSYIALLTADSKNVAAYTGLQDATSDRPTATNMDLLLDYVNGSSADTVLYANRTGRRMLWQLKDSKMQTTPADNNYNDTFELWNGVRVVLDENILDTESSVLD